LTDGLLLEFLKDEILSDLNIVDKFYGYCRGNLRIANEIFEIKIFSTLDYCQYCQRNFKVEVLPTLEYRKRNLKLKFCRLWIIANGILKLKFCRLWITVNGIFWFKFAKF
jgi:hypothetical protein